MVLEILVAMLEKLARVTFLEGIKTHHFLGTWLMTINKNTSKNFKMSKRNQPRRHMRVDNNS
jgi:hypothetical protein